MNGKFASFSVIGGLVVALSTGFLTNTVLLGAEHYGYPLAWLIRLVLAPEYSPWRVNVPNLIVNVAVWIGIVSTLLFILTRAREM